MWIVKKHTTLLNSNGGEVLRDSTDKGCEGDYEHHQKHQKIILKKRLNYFCTICSQQKQCKPDQNRCQYVHHKWPGTTVFVWRPKELCWEADWYGPRKERKKDHFGLAPLA